MVWTVLAQTGCRGAGVPGCRQCLPLKGKHCRKPHCRNGVVDMFGHWQSVTKWQIFSHCDIRPQEIQSSIWREFLAVRKNKVACPSELRVPQNSCGENLRFWRGRLSTEHPPTLPRSAVKWHLSNLAGSGTESAPRHKHFKSSQLSLLDFERTLSRTSAISNFIEKTMKYIQF